MLLDVERARELALRDVVLRPRNTPLAMTMKNDRHGSMPARAPL